MTRSIFILLGYLALTALVLIMTVGLVAYGQGYSYDLSRHRLTHNGLVIISTQPSGATVRVDSKSGTKKTPYHASFEAGSYRFHVTKAGYEPWTKILNVIASQVTLAEYIVLLPQHRPESILDTRVQMQGQVISKDHRHLAYIAPGANGGLFVLDLITGKTSRIYQPAAVNPEVGEEVLTDVKWSDDASHLLLGSNLASTHIVRLITASDGSQTNLTEKYHFDFSTLQFSARDWRQMYWLSPDGLRRLDAGAQTITGILAEKVSQFVVAGDHILYVSSSELGESLGSIDSRDRKLTVIQALVKSPTYSIKYASYQGQDILVIVPSADRIGTMYTNIYSTDITTKVIAREVTSVLFSSNARMVTFYAADKFITYDLEQSGLLARSVIYTTLLPSSQRITNVSYYDGAHLLMNQSGRVIFTEFDGMNSIDLGPIAPGFTPYRLADQRAVIDTSYLGSNYLVNSISLR